MEMLASLWLPILVSAVLVFVASWLSWMLLPFHKQEWARLADEDAFFRKLKELGIAPGKYMFPGWDGESCKDPATLERWKAGPHGMLHLWSRAPGMGRNLVLTFLSYLLVGVLVAYLAGSVLGPGAAYGSIFRVTGVAAILAHAFGHLGQAIWFHTPRAGLVANLLDGVVYGLLTAGAFAGLWPAA